MDIKQLDGLISEKKEIIELEEKLKRLENSKDFVSDTVKGSSRNFPFTQRIFMISGLESGNYTKIERCRNIISSRKERLSKRVLDAEEFIDKVEDSEIRRILTLKYIEGKSWRKVSRLVYGYPCEDRTRMKITRFFTKK